MCPAYSWQHENKLLDIQILYGNELGIEQLGQLILTAIEKVWKVEERRKIGFCSCYNVPSVLNIYSKGIQRVRRVAFAKYVTHHAKHTCFHYHHLISATCRRAWQLCTAMNNSMFVCSICTGSDNDCRVLTDAWYFIRELLIP